tara:strand:+ start:210 stop:503 length:294 start_codon:yes stop_codon:yes gene_type:complete
MKYELLNRGKEVNIVSINQASSANTQTALSDACTFPILQDTEEVGAWELLGGGKDDFFLYKSDGTLAVYLQARGAISTNLATPQGYANVIQTLLLLE